MNEKLEEIISGWKNFLFNNKKHEALAKNRMTICVECPELNKRNRCNQCGCYMPAKVRSTKKSTKCPLNKW